MYRSLQYVRIDPGMTSEDMTSICEEAVQRNQKYLEEAGDFTIHPSVTRGVGSDNDLIPTVCNQEPHCKLTPYLLELSKGL